MVKAPQSSTSKETEATKYNSEIRVCCRRLQSTHRYRRTANKAWYPVRLSQTLSNNYSTKVQKESDLAMTRSGDSQHGRMDVIWYVKLFDSQSREYLATSGLI